MEVVDGSGNVTEVELERLLIATDEAFSLYNQDVRYLYQKAEVLAIDKTLPADLGEGAAADAAALNAGLITLAVPPHVVQSVLGIGAENIYLSLVPRNYEPVPLAPLDVTDLTLPGEDECRLTPYGPALEAYPACGLEVPEEVQQ